MPGLEGIAQMAYTQAADGNVAVSAMVDISVYRVGYMLHSGIISTQDAQG